MNKIVIRTQKEMRIIELKKLLAITVNDYLCTFVFENTNDNFVCTKSLSEFEKDLPSHFVRINNNIIVNINQIVKIDTQKRVLFLINQKEYSISVRKIGNLKK